jgi:glucokinase
MPKNTAERADLCLGLESGGTKLVVSLGSRDGTITRSQSIPRPPSHRAPDTLRDLVKIGREFLAEADAPVVGVGYGFGGTVNRETGTPVLNLHEEGWADIDAKALLTGAFDLPVFCENDCKVAALAEAHIGSGSREGTSIYITVGSGIGGGIVYEGRVLETSIWGEAEIGHIVMDPGGPRCSCGNRGCLEALCSGWGMGKRALGHAADPRFAGSELASRIAALPLHEISRAVFAAYPADPLAEVCVDEFCATLGQACSFLCNLLTPRAIVLGGGVMSNTWLIPKIEAAARIHTAPYLQQPTRFAAAALGERTVSSGAILFAYQQLIPAQS